MADNEIKVEEVVKLIPPTLNQYHTLLNLLYTIRYKALIYKLIKGGHATITNIAKDAEVSEVAIRGYIDDIDKMIQAQKT